MAAISFTKNAIFTLSMFFPRSHAVSMPSVKLGPSRVRFATSASKYNEGRRAGDEDKNRASEKAKETSEQLKEKAKGYAHDTKESTKSAAQSGAEKAKEGTYKAAEKGSETTYDVKETVEGIAGKAKETVKGAWDKTKKTTQKLKETVVGKDSDPTSSSESDSDGEHVMDADVKGGQDLNKTKKDWE